MIPLIPPRGSIRRHLTWQMLAIAAVLSALLYLSVRGVAGTAVQTTQDRILGAATIAIVEELRGSPEGVEIDIPVTTFSMLGAVGEDRIFYRILVNGDTVTGYDDLPGPDAAPQGLTPVFYSHAFRGEEVRIAAVERSVLVGRNPVSVLVLVAQTQSARAAIVARLANRAALMGLGFFVFAAGLSLVTARSVLSPMGRLADAVERRGPTDLRPVEQPVPAELTPLVASLNDFIARLSTALARTETFIAEAAHHIRTPLATLRTRTEIALHDTPDEATRAHLRSIIRSVDDSARTAGQLLDHAAVVYRSDQRSDEALDPSRLVGDMIERMRPTAELKDMTLTLDTRAAPAAIEADRLLIESAIRNLLDNAIKYSNPDGQVEIEVGTEAGMVVFRFLDRGRGLGGESDTTLARRFRRGGNVSDVVGSGLGLTIVREAARAHGGTVRLSEREGGGTCAELLLPLG